MKHDVTGSLSPCTFVFVMFMEHFHWSVLIRVPRQQHFNVRREDGHCNEVQGHIPAVCANDISQLQRGSTAR